MKTLFETADDYGDIVETHAGSGCKFVCANRVRRRENYWNLSDYAVSSVSGPTIWFVPKTQTKKFYLARFHAITMRDKADEVKKACDILNTLTEPQVKAVELFAESE